MVQCISVWVKCPICGWNEATEKKYEELRKQECADGNTFLQMFCDVFEFDRKTVSVKSQEKFENVQKCTFTVMSKAQIEHKEINQTALEVRLVCRVYGDGGRE